MASSPLTVSEVTQYLQDLLSADDTLTDIWIEGEVTEVFTSRAGHVYFNLADDECKLKCVMFRNAAARERYRPEAGQSCAAHGRVSIYGREGQYQLYVDFVRPAGIGLAALEFELLKQRLTADGLFEPSRKRPLPERIMIVGLVTSAEGAVRHDVENVMRRRNPFMTLILAPAAVQGESAPVSLRSALAGLIADGQCDVIVVGRGGGSATDLSAFNDEQLVRDVFASPVPVISAVGHESDWTLLDLVADLRAPTPSAAAELISVQVGLAIRQTEQALWRLASSLGRRISDLMLDVGQFREELIKSGPVTLIPELRSDVEENSTALALLLRSGLERQRVHIVERTSDLKHLISDRTNEATQKIGGQCALLEVLEPAATLARGYAVLVDEQSELPVQFVRDAQPGQLLRAHVQDGSVVTRVESAG